ncbi:LemA family protein [Patescibacteria group bacterium]|nr:LemA family protein [Patescibacteria group bacterium]
MSFSTIVILVVVAVIVWLIYTFNRLVVLRMRSKEALSDIDVQTKRRYDLIPNLIETVKGYMTHERNVLENVTKARTEAMSGSGDAVDKAGKENMLSGTLKTLFAVSENYPDLKANANFLELQRELSDTENKIQAARRFYNSNVKSLNIKVEVFPTRLVAGTFGFSKMKFFEVSTEAEKEPVEVKF